MNAVQKTHLHRIALVGSGPAAFFAAEALLQAGKGLAVDMIERLPTPFGLVRYGVAPDAQTTKQVARAFEKTASREGFSFFGNVTVGKDVPVDMLRSCYDAVVFAHGADGQRRLGIRGEDLPGSLTAREVVNWYNGYPGATAAPLPLPARSVALVGNGNVAMDVARMLAKDPGALAGTDMPEPVREALGGSGIREIHVVARRGPAQAAFSYPELEALDRLEHCELSVPAADLELDAVSEEELADPSHHNRVHNCEILRAIAQRQSAGKSRVVAFHFLASPVEVLGGDRVRGLMLERNELTGPAGAQRARGTGEKFELACDAVVWCVGYRGVATPGLPFDETRCVIPNEEGRVTDGGEVVPGLYVVGWAGSGPVGLIGSSKIGSRRAAKLILGDLERLPVESCAKGDLRSYLAQRGVQVVDMAGWRRIDRAEVERGAPLGKPREKITSRDELLRIARDT